MFKNFLVLMIMMMMGLLFLGSTHPMGLMIMMLLMTMWYSMYMYILSGTFWYGFILLLVMMSGVLVIFSYMASMVPNERFEFSWVVVFMMVFVMWKEEMMEWGEEMSMESLKLWDGGTMSMMMYMVVFLMVVMFMVVWLSDWWDGAIRV